jgi:excisionase family DNA binding protein
MRNLTDERVNGRRAFSVAELAGQYGVSPGFLRLEIERKNLAALRLGRRVVVLKEEFDRYLRERQR